MPFTQMGLIYKNQALTNLGLELARTQGSWLVWIVGTISLMLSFYVIYLGTKVFMRFVWGAMILTWVMLAVYAGVLLSVNPEIVHKGMMLVQNIDYQKVFAKAKELGWTPGFMSVAATIMAGMTFMNLTCLGSTYSANIAGEIKRVDKAQPLAQYGSIILFIIYYQIFTYVTYHGFGKDLMEAISMLNSEGRGCADLRLLPADSLPVGLCHAESDPASARRVLGLGLDQLGWRNGTGFCTGPQPVCLCLRRHAARQDQRSQPPRFTGLCSSAGLRHLLGPVHGERITPLLSAYQVYTITIWFFGWIFLSIAAIAFPYSPQGYLGEGTRDHPPEHLRHPVDRDRRRGRPDHQPGDRLLHPRSGLLGDAINYGWKGLAVSFGFYMLLPVVLYFVAVPSTNGAARRSNALQGNSSRLTPGIRFRNRDLPSLTQGRLRPVGRDHPPPGPRAHPDRRLLCRYLEINPPRVFFTTDLHGSTVVFKKFINAGKVLRSPGSDPGRRHDRQDDRPWSSARGRTLQRQLSGEVV